MGEKPAQQREPSSELLGPYALLTEIARGQLTTVHLARKHGALGFQRLMAIKRLRPEYARDHACMRLLLDEARVTAGLHHANLVNVLDVGNEAGCYVVSDYIEGDSLAGLLSRGAERHPRYLVPIFVEVLNGLHAVHTALDEDDVPYGMVHQAPHARHILVGIDGTARVTDFSQVKAHGLEPNPVRAERLQTGYLAPEQALDPDRIDPRADLFIVGIVLWEALTGERLFASDSEQRSFQNLLHRRIPRPSEVGLRPPRCFDAVCMRALDRDLTARYDSALEMARELRDVALNQALYATAGEIGRWVKNICRAELSERRRRVGAELVSTETPIQGSGLFRMPSGPSDPYGSGLIYGGSHSVVKLDDRSSADLDKTPAVGLRGQVRGRLREDEPTAPHPLVQQATESAPAEPPLSSRKGTLPYGTPAVKLPDGLFSDPNPTPSRPAAETAESESTQPAAFVPARPGARRDSNLPSPGAYSQVAPERRSRTSRPAPEPQVAPSATPSAGSAFEELATSQFAGLSPRASSVPRRPAAVIEEPPRIISRQDSVPVRRSIPEGPVGSPHTPVPSAPEAATEAAPSFEAPTRPALGGFGALADPAVPRSDWPLESPTGSSVSGRHTQLGFAEDPFPQEAAPRELPNAMGAARSWDAPPHAERSMLLPPGSASAEPLAPAPSDLSVPPAPALGSLTPPNTAANTLPPLLTEDPTRRRNLGVWVVSGALAAIILLAIVVGARRWANEAPARAAAASGSSAGQDEPEDLRGADGPSGATPAEAAPPAQGNPVGSAASTKPSDTAALDRAGETGFTPHKARVAPRAPVAKPVSASKVVVQPAPGGAPKALPAAPKPSAPARTRAKPAIPDNPY